jgi:hypothetical protein
MLLDDLTQFGDVKGTIESNPELVAALIRHMLNLFDTLEESDFADSSI